MPDLALNQTPVVDAIVGREPSWIVRTGITLVFVIFMMLLMMTWFIQYPDNIIAPITLTTQQTPVQLVAKTNARITHIFVSEGEFVTQGAPLVLLENSVKYENLVVLKSRLKQDGFYSLSELKIKGLGELQPSVNQVNQALHELHVFETSAKLFSRIENTRTLSEQYKLLQEQIDSKMITMQSKMTLEVDLLENNRKLKAQGLVTAVEMVRIENRYLDKKISLKDIKIQRELYNIKIQELAYKLSEYRIERDEHTQQLKTNLNNSYSALMSKIDQWQQQYLLTAPSPGIISFSNYWSVNQQVNTSDVVVSIVNKSAVKIGKMLLSQQGAGKVEAGQRVTIELASFPAVEYGKIEGVVEAISLIPQQKGYMVEVTLPETLITTYGKLLPFTPNLIGQAKIVTQEKRLIERFFDKITYIFDSHN